MSRTFNVALPCRLPPWDLHAECWPLDWRVLWLVAGNWVTHTTHDTEHICVDSSRAVEYFRLFQREAAQIMILNLNGRAVWNEYKEIQDIEKLCTYGQSLIVSTASDRTTPLLWHYSMIRNMSGEGEADDKYYF